ncbi:hypothetical protein Vi05172_g8885 [Venturia inaequalis]|nr:hypothetical protein Vi05172_g8885 [Venturia inaequalis]
MESDQHEHAWIKYCTAPNAATLTNLLDARGADPKRKSFVEHMRAAPIFHELFARFPWLQGEFDEYSETRFSASRRLFEDDPNQMTALLKEYVNRRTCAIIVNYSMKVPARGGGESIVQVLERAARDPDSVWRTDREGKVVRLRVQQFCMAIGCRSEDSIIANIHFLREKALSNLPRPEASLQRLVEMLTEQVRELKEDKAKLQTQKPAIHPIVTILAYRNVVEHLCETTVVPVAAGKKARKRVPTSERWSVYWNNAVSNADKAGHPLGVLKRDTRLTWAQVVDVGDQLFKTLSANIHHYYDDEYTVDPAQWTTAALEAKILKAMKPIVPVAVPGQLREDIDWDAERKRYD